MYMDDADFFAAQAEELSSLTNGLNRRLSAVVSSAVACTSAALGAACAMASLPFDGVAPETGRGGFGQAKYRAYLANLAAKKSFEKEARERAEAASGRSEREARERGFQIYLQGANSNSANSNSVNSTGPNRRRSHALALQSAPSAHVVSPAEAPHRTTQRRKWELGTPIVLRITEDGEAKGELLHLEQQRQSMGLSMLALCNRPPKIR